MDEPLLEVQILPSEGTLQRDLVALIEELALLGILATMLPKASIVAPSYNQQRRQHNAEILLDRVRLAPSNSRSEVDCSLVCLGDSCQTLQQGDRTFPQHFRHRQHLTFPHGLRRHSLSGEEIAVRRTGPPGRYDHPG